MSKTYMQAILDAYRFEPVAAHGADSVTTAATLTKPAGANKVLLQALTQNVRYTLDGSTPTTSSGFQLKAGDAPRQIAVDGGITLKVVTETGTASLQYQWGY